MRLQMVQINEVVLYFHETVLGRGGEVGELQSPLGKLSFSRSLWIMGHDRWIN